MTQIPLPWAIVQEKKSLHTGHDEKYGAFGQRLNTPPLKMVEA